MQGFIPIVVIVTVVIALAASGGAFLIYQKSATRPLGTQHSVIELPQETVHKPATAEKAIPTPTAPLTSESQPATQPSFQSTALDQFLAIEKELFRIKNSKSFLGEEYEQKIERRILNLEREKYAQGEIDRLRQLVFELSPHLQDLAKKNQASKPSNCVSNSNPLFTNHITDMDRVRYIGPPPTMGAGPSLKTHSYMGTDHARVPIYAPTNLTLKSGSYYVGGPYLIDFNASCEVTVRFGHITEPIEAIKKLLPSEPKSDSRTEELAPITFAAGELLGYTKGTDTAGNWDFGVYNITVQNRYTNDPEWGNSDTYTTAVCPFDYFADNLKKVYVSKFDLTPLGGNPPHGESFCKSQ